jgi:hypothetical protein
MDILDLSTRLSSTLNAIAIGSYSPNGLFSRVTASGAVKTRLRVYPVFSVRIPASSRHRILPGSQHLKVRLFILQPQYDATALPSFATSSHRMWPAFSTLMTPLRNGVAIPVLIAPGHFCACLSVGNFYWSDTPTANE